MGAFCLLIIVHSNRLRIARLEPVFLPQAEHPLPAHPLLLLGEILIDPGTAVAMLTGLKRRAVSTLGRRSRTTSSPHMELSPLDPPEITLVNTFRSCTSDGHLEIVNH